tara:strand:- start:91907 stop:92053 length:147 start_codon:yes stop_codon:yes gene_type:complete
MKLLQYFKILLFAENPEPVKIIQRLHFGDRNVLLQLILYLAAAFLSAS